jgi:hypothetical protein
MVFTFFLLDLSISNQWSAAAARSKYPPRIHRNKSNSAGYLAEQKNYWTNYFVPVILMTEMSTRVWVQDAPGFTKCTQRGRFAPKYTWLHPLQNESFSLYQNVKPKPCLSQYCDMVLVCFCAFQKALAYLKTK